MKISVVLFLISTVILASNGKISNKFSPHYLKSPSEKNDLGAIHAPKYDGDINSPGADEVEDVNKYISSSTRERKEHKSKSHHRDNKHGHHGRGVGGHGDHHRHNVDRPSLTDNLYPNEIESAQHKPSKIQSAKDNVGSSSMERTKPMEGKPSEKVADPCKILKCKRRHLCMVNPATEKAECLSKKLFRQRQRQMKSSKANRKVKVSPKPSKVDAESGKHSEKHARNTKRERRRKGKSKKRNPFSSPKKIHRFVTKMKNKAEHFKNSYSEKKRHELHQIRQLAHTKHGVMLDHDHQQKGENYQVNPHKVSSPATPTKPYCSAKDLSEMSRRLLDWFKVLQDKENREHDHVIQKRNSMKKELHEQDECICQAPVRYEFLNLDKDDDGILSEVELENIESNGYEHCIRPFVLSCDHNEDGHLSNKEWCCCFADVMPPCLAELNRIPSTVSSGAPAVMPGARVPQCDSDGFYKPLQCHSSTGFCWCVDRNGVELQGTNTRGTLNCEDLDSGDNTMISQNEVKDY